MVISVESTELTLPPVKVYEPFSEVSLAETLSWISVGSTELALTVSENVSTTRSGGTVLTMSSRNDCSLGLVVSGVCVATSRGVCSGITGLEAVSFIKSDVNVIKVLFLLVAKVVICLIRLRSASEIDTTTTGPLGLDVNEELVRVCRDWISSCRVICVTSSEPTSIVSVK